MPALPYHVELIRLELSRRKSRNPRYSLRCFARNLGIDPSMLSRFLRGKQELSLESYCQIMPKLPLDGERRILFIDSIQQVQSMKVYQALALEPQQPDAA